MRVRLLFAIAFFTVILAPPVRLTAQDADSARAFLISVYQRYQNGGKGIDSTGPRAGLYYHSSLLGLMRTDAKAAGPDNVGVIDADPICGCQDWEGIWSFKIDLHLDAPQRARAVVSFALFDPRNHPKDPQRKLEITLIPEHRQWRIYDIVDETNPRAPFAVRKELERDIASYRRKPSG